MLMLPGGKELEKPFPIEYRKGAKLDLSYNGGENKTNNTFYMHDGSPPKQKRFSRTDLSYGACDGISCWDGLEIHELLKVFIQYCTQLASLEKKLERVVNVVDTVVHSRQVRTLVNLEAIFVVMSENFLI